MDDAIREIKCRNMDMLADYIKELYKKPILKDLFLEVTSRCNAKCEHCGSVLTVSEFNWVLSSLEKIG